MKIAVITGGSSGIGLAAAELFAQKGYTVYALSRRGAQYRLFVVLQKLLPAAAVNRIVAKIYAK